MYFFKACLSGKERDREESVQEDWGEPGTGVRLGRKVFTKVDNGW